MHHALRLVNPLSQDHAYLQPSLVMGLLRVLRHNVSRGTTAVAVFELGRVRHDGDEAPRLGIMVSGEWFPDWTASRQAADFWVLKGLLEAVARQVSGLALEFSPARHGWSEAGTGARLGTVSSFHLRTFIVISSFPTRRNDRDANRRARAAYERAVKITAEHGWGQYRSHAGFMDLALSRYSANDNALSRFHATLKDALDPNGILSAGRYGLWPKHLRKA